MVIKSDKMAYDGEKYVMPLWQLDTSKYTVTHYNEKNHDAEITPFHAECVRCHIDSIKNNNANILKEIVNTGEILDYLNHIEEKVNDMIDRQVERWKKSDEDYLAAKETGDILEEARILNMLTLMAKEIAYKNVVYI